MSESGKKITDFIGRARRALMLITSVSGAMLTLAVILGLSFLLILLNGLFFLECGARSALFFIWLGISLGALFYWVLWPFINIPRERRVAIDLEREYPELDSRLVSAYDFLKIEPRSYGYSGDLIAASIVDAEKRTRGLKPERIAPFSMLRERSAYLVFAVLLIVGFLASSPSVFHTGIARGSNPFQYIMRPTLTTLKVEPGDAGVTKYKNLEITIAASGKLPEDVTILRAFDGGAERTFSANRNPENDREWSFLFEDVKRDFTYRVEGGDFISRPFKVAVVDRPRVVGLTLTFDYPDYTGLQTVRLEENEGTVDVPYGTYVTVEARFSKKIERSELNFSDSTQKAMQIDDRSATGSFRAIKPGSYRLLAVDNEGLANDDPIEYPIRVRSDEYPTVEITHPGVDIDLTEDMLIPLSVLGEDDYGFSGFQLAFTIEKSPEDTSRIKIPFDSYRRPQVSVEYYWDLGRLAIFPNDIVLYWVEALDNDRVTGPKKAVSRVYSARFPSIDEIIKDVISDREDQITDVEEISRQERDLQEELKELTREMKRASEITYEQREDLREALQTQRELAEQLEKTAEEYQQTTEKVTEQQLASSEIIQKMLEVQKLLQDVATEEMREAMQKLQEALDSMDPEELRRAAEEFQMTQEELLERLDRTLALLKRMQVEQRVEDMKALAEKLKEMENKVSEGLEDGSMSQKDAERMQDRITEGSELLEKGLEELAEMMSEFPDMPSEQAKALANEVNQNSPSKKSGQCSSLMKSGSMNKCAGKAEELSEQFEQIAQKLQQMQEQMQQQLSAETIAAIRRAVFGLLDLSARQENLLGTLAKDIRSRELARGLGKDGADISLALGRVTAEVVSIAQKNMMIPPNIGAILGSSLREMGAMLVELEQGRGYSASPRGYEAMAAMNVAAEKLLETMDMMSSQSSSSCSGGQSFFQKMQGMCDKQGQINQSTIPIAQGQGSSGSMPGGLTPDQQAAASRLAGEQEAVRKSMEELAGEAAQRSDIAGRMDNIVEEMEEVIQDLRHRGADERTLNRQERIMNRMLDVQKSLHRQEYEERRKSRTGENIVRRSPDRLPEDLGERRDLLQQQLLRALNQPYPKEYEGLIKSYFQALRENAPAEGK